MSNETERTLHELKLPGMASCWSSLEETHQLDKLTLREGMQIMLPDACLNSALGEEHGRETMKRNARFFTDYFFEKCREKDC